MSPIGKIRSRPIALPIHPSPKDLLDHSRIFLKADLAYLVGLGAAATAFQLSANDFVLHIGTFAYFPWVFCVIAMLDAVIYSHRYSRWINPGPSKWSLFSDSVLHMMSTCQTIYHALFLTFLVVGLAAYAQGQGRAYAEIDAMAQLQTAVEIHILETGQTPKAIDDLKQTDATLKAIYLIGKNLIKIEKPANLKYRILLAGRDGKLGTPDDAEITPEVKLRGIADEFIGRNTAKSKN
jgi:hypothetical protein